ncbi:type II toxin-antitoxin system VapC family toxin [Streptomyces liangshanensis]|uniref:type II toxin-antitoxin system VapC family toxin n=1 Tax=Streptomyces liangshanensis TaxID=2717324 RepID=UPI0036DD3B37
MRRNEPKSAYIDACCYIEWATGKSHVVDSWVEAARSKKLQLFASTLLLAEARGGSRTQPNPQAEARIRTLLTEPYVTLVDVSRRVGLTAREIIADTPRIKGWDAVHLATAVVARAEVLLTSNTKHFTPGQVLRGVWIDEPYQYGGEGLF